MIFFLIVKALLKLLFWWEAVYLEKKAEFGLAPNLVICFSLEKLIQTS